MQDVAPTGPGHNVVGCDVATFHKHVALIGAKKALLDVAKSEHKKSRQAAKADGILLKDLDRALIVADMTTDEQRQYLNTQAAYLKWLKVPIGSQMSMFDATDFMDDADTIEEETLTTAEGAGFRDGLKGKGENPHEGNTPAGQAWMKGNHDGADQRRQALAMGGG